MHSDFETTMADAGTGLVHGTDRHVVRPLAGPSDYAACVELQRIVWGEGYDTVPGALIKVSQRVGGLAAGAFAPDGGMDGFVFGLTGVVDGELVHWSHMLAVRPAVRDRGLGTRLKAYQLEAVRALGVVRVEWTFDPLIGRNAHRNVNGLAAEVRGYVPDMYPDTGSGLHTFGTDRLVVSVATRAGVARPVRALPPGAGSAPVVNANGSGVEGLASRPPFVRIRIPADAEALAERDLAAVRAWRSSTRAAFQGALAAGYRVVGFDRESAAHGAYILTRA
jgi:predicted GNAT superfamily acetyltransferase